MKEGFVIKRCPKCGGNVYMDKDYNGWYEQCLQCGYTRELGSIVDLGKVLNKQPATRAK